MDATLLFCKHWREVDYESWSIEWCLAKNKPCAGCSGTKEQCRYPELFERKEEE